MADTIWLPLFYIVLTERAKLGGLENRKLFEGLCGDA